VYSLGAVLYWLLTGRPPFGGENRQQLATAILNEVIRSPSTINPALAPFNELCWRALARHADDRYQSMQAFADALVAAYLQNQNGAAAADDTEPLSSASAAEAREQLLDAADQLAEVDELRDIAQELRSHARDPEATDADVPPDDQTDSDWPAGVARAELEAITAVHLEPHRYPAEPTWRHSLPLNRPVRLGRDPEFADWAVPNDRLISRLHAILEWNGSMLTVARRGVQRPDFPSPPANQIWFNNKPVERCTVKPGEWFVIGHTRFFLHLALNEVEVTTDATTAQVADPPAAVIGSRVDPTAVLRAIEQLQNSLQPQAPREAVGFSSLLTAVMDALPQVALASVIYVPKDGENSNRSLLDRISTVESATRSGQSSRLHAPLLNGELVHNAVNVHRRSCTELSAFRYLTAGFEDSEADWAICTPLQDNSRYALYLAGEVSHEWSLPGDASDPKRVREELARYQHVAELLVALVEAARRRARWESLQRAMLRTMPGSLRKHAENPEELERLLTPREQEITTLFCNLQDYSGYASRHLALLQAQREAAGALNARATVITERAGVVVGQHGEALRGFWGWPSPQDNQVESAANAAMLMQLQTSPGLLAGRLGVGLTHGSAVVGRLTPHEVAAVEVFGPVVSLAAQLGELAQIFGVAIVMNEAVATRLQTADPTGNRWRVRRLGRVRLPGHPTFTVYDLNFSLGSSWLSGDRYRELLTLWHEAVEFFIGGNWRQAQEAFEADFANDPVARYLLRIMNRTDGKPPDDWDGSLNPFPAE